jgi:hypothetical protein
MSDNSDWYREIQEHIGREEAWLKATEPMFKAIGYALMAIGVAAITGFCVAFYLAFAS